MSFQHGFHFDPSYGYSLESLLSLEPPPEPADFSEFWTARYTRALEVDPAPRLFRSPIRHPRMEVREIEYSSTDGFTIRGWLLAPSGRSPTCGFLLGHGYGGIDGPSLELPLEDAVYLVPCFRGLSRSRRPPISDDPSWHVLHDIQDRDRYILGGCVDDLWTGVSTLLGLHPELSGHLGYAGISFGGGIGALALPWDGRIARGHLNVPSFGHWPLRLDLPTLGSATAVQAFARAQGQVPESLAYFDAATAARRIRQPMHLALALFDPSVAPPGQFAVYNAIPGEKRLFVLSAGHFDHPGLRTEERDLQRELSDFFAPLRRLSSRSR